MANVEKMEKEFNALLKKYEGAAKTREWWNAARGNQYSENADILNKEIAGFKKRFEAALKEEVTVPEP